MKSGNQKLWSGFLAVLFAVTLIISSPAITVASEGDSLETLNAGAAVVLEADITTEKEKPVKTVKEEPVADTKEKEKKNESTLVMANVNDSVNVRAEATEEAEKVGKLYKDCGGQIVERNAGWTKIRSGDLEGWIKDEYLLFDQEAEKLASEVGHLIATVHADALRVRKEASDDAGVYGMVAMNETIDAIENNGEWVAIDYEGNMGYLSAEFVSTDFKIDTGETIEVIQERERKEAEEKAKLKQNRGAVPVGASDVDLLAALIQCEAGGESYEGQLAVGAVVMNRVRSGGYPNSVQGVIYASGQFTPALNGKVAAKIAAGVKASCVQAAAEAINGASNIGGATHFRRAGSREGIVIGNHVFW